MNIAVLIDAENVLPAFAEQIFEHAASLGTVVRREIYGAAQSLNTWVEPVLKYAIHSNLTIRPTKYKNSSDIALVIGAMDMIGEADAMVIASSDSDFSSLAVRLRSAGTEVIGMGTEKANPLWKTACSSFVTLTAKPAAGKNQQPAKQPAKPSQPAPQPAKAAQPSQAQQPAAQPAKAPVPAPAAQPAQAQQPAKPQPKVAATHTERAAIIRACIAAQMEAAGDRLNSNVLFTALNNLPEYRVDQQRSKRKPMNYLLRQFGDMIRFEEDEEGMSWCLRASAQPAESPTKESQPAEAKQAPDAPQAQSAPDEPSREVELLMEQGLARDVAERIASVFSSSGSLRAAYNKLRAEFGATTGREYYLLVKDIAEKQ